MSIIRNLQTEFDHDSSGGSLRKNMWDFLINKKYSGTLRGMLGDYFNAEDSSVKSIKDGFKRVLGDGTTMKKGLSKTKFRTNTKWKTSNKGKSKGKKK